MRRRTIVPGRDPFGRIVPNWELNALVGGGGVKSFAADGANGQFV